MKNLKTDIKQYLYSAIVISLVVSGLYYVFANTDYPWQWYRIWDYIVVWDEGELWAGDLLYGVQHTLYLVICSIILSCIFGILVAWGNFAKGKIANITAKGYVTFIRNTPVLVQIYLTYFLIAPILGMDRFVTGVLVLSIYEGAFVAEIIRGAIQSINRGQSEAASSLGLSKTQTTIKIIFPQALRLIIAPLTNVSINLLKHSSIVSVIAVQDLTTVGRDLISDTYLAMEIWLAVAVLYWILSAIFAVIGRFIEKRIKWSS